MTEKKMSINRRFYKPRYRSDPFEEQLRYNYRQDKSLDLFNYETFVKIEDREKKINQIKKNVKEFLKMENNQTKESIVEHKTISALYALLVADINEELTENNPVIGHISLEIRPFGLTYCIQTITLTNNHIYQRLVSPSGVSPFKLISNSGVQK